jgi:hypothetical protein
MKEVREHSSEEIFGSEEVEVRGDQKLEKMM